VIRPYHRLFLPLAAAALLGACTGEENDGDKTRDFETGSSLSLSDLQAGIWVDPNGCDHWIIDDGVEGYMSPRLDPRGRPVCSGVAPPEFATGGFRAGQDLNDQI
jgi:hypothetical protein